jgi:hypothetical protein
MKQYSEIARVHPELLADVGRRPFLQEEQPEHLPVAGGKLIEHLMNEAFAFFGDQRHVQIDPRVDRIRGVIVDRFELPVVPEKFVHHVVADGVNVSAEAFGELDLGSGSQGADHAEHSLLTDIVNELRRTKTAPELQKDQFAEVGVKMLLDKRVPLLEPLNIFRTEPVELQRVAGGS